MNAEYVKKLALPEEVKEIYPVTPEMDQAVAKTKREVEQVIEGFSDKLILIIGPCSADNEDSVIDYISRHFFHRKPGEMRSAAVYAARLTECLDLL